MNTQSLQMLARITQVDRLVRVTWSLENSGSDSHYICVRSNIGNELKREPYSYLTDKDTCLVLTFREIPIPPDLDVYAPDIPFFQVLEPGGTIHESFEMPTPILEIHPYGDYEYPKARTLINVSRISFSVEHFPCSEQLFARKTPLDPNLFKARGKVSQLLELQFQLEKPIEVLKRLDNFYRLEE